METVRLVVPLVVLLLVGSLLGVQAATYTPGTAPPDDPDEARPYPGDTLIGVQAKGWFGNDNGTAIVVNPEGETVWEYDPPNSRVFDVEALDNGNVLASVATVETDDCPPEVDDQGRCVHNRVVELDYPNTTVVWSYEWWDVFPEHHEVHDADRLSNGETAIVDMGNDRAFTVDREGRITWQWNASEHLAEGTPFFDEHVPAGSADEFRQGGPESDWTHMNDIDRLENGNFQLSIRNFDVVVEVDPETNEIVDVVGAPTRHRIMNEQHNPMRIESGGTLIVADSENDRVVEIDVESERIVWQYDGSGSGELLQWPRDADRLPNGNTLVTDSRNFRVLEVGPNGSVVWRYEMKAPRGIVYEADRLGVEEEPGGVPSGRDLTGRTSGGALASTLATVEGWMGFVPFLPVWFGFSELLAALVGLGALGFLVREAANE